MCGTILDTLFSQEKAYFTRLWDTTLSLTFL